MSSIPSTIGLPNEILGQLDFSLPSDAKSNSVRVQPSNISQIVSTAYSTGAVNNAVLGDFPFPSQQLIFDCPAGGSPSQFIDTRMSSLSFRMNVAVSGAAGATCTMTSGYLRSHANSFFDRLFITGQDGQILEDINEYGLVNDTLLALQQNNSVRDGIALQMGYLSSTAIESQGHAIGIFNGRQLVTGDNESHNYSVPLCSGILGVLDDRFINIGRTSKLTLTLQTINILPLSITCNNATNATSFVVTLSDFALNLQYIDIGLSALKLLDSQLVDGKMYSHAITYRTSTATLPSTSGAVSLLCGLRASSVKSLFARYYENGVLV